MVERQGSLPSPRGITHNCRWAQKKNAFRALITHMGPRRSHLASGLWQEGGFYRGHLSLSAIGVIRGSYTNFVNIEIYFLSVLLYILTTGVFKDLQATARSPVKPKRRLRPETTFQFSQDASNDLWSRRSLRNVTCFISSPSPVEAVSFRRRRAPLRDRRSNSRWRLRRGEQSRQVFYRNCVNITWGSSLLLVT